MANMPPPPSGPADHDLRNIIDKLAQYVARNGPQAEEKARQDQYHNPKFGFLFGRQYSDYYNYRLRVEIQNLPHPPLGQFPPGPRYPPPGGYPPPGLPPGPRHMPPMHAGTPPRHPPPPHGGYAPVQQPAGAPPVVYPPSQAAGGFNVQEAEAKIAEMRKQVSDSEANLKAQYDALQTQKQAKVDEMWRKAEEKRIRGLTDQVGLDIDAFEQLVDYLNTSGSKEAISNSKKWIFDNCQTDRLREIILTYLLHRVKATTNDSLRLHILYLVNDWAHFCQRKKLDNVRQMLSRYVPKLYAFTANSPTADQTLSLKLDKLIGVWEGHKYFDDNCYKQLRNPSAIMTAEQATAAAEQQRFGADIDKEVMGTYNTYAAQHQEFERHINSQIATMEAQIAAFRQQEAEERERQQREADRPRKSRFGPPGGGPPMPGGGPPPLMGPPIPLSAAAPPIPSLFSAPPLGPPVKREYSDKDLIPKGNHYDLPAGMMVPLVKAEDCTFKALKAEDLRLPPPEPPTEHLIRELERFYNFHPTPENPRDAEGWEQKGLFEFYVRKAEHKLKLEESLKRDGKTLEDAITNKFVNVKDAESSDEERSASPDAARPSFGTSTTGGFVAPGPVRGGNEPFKVPPLPLDREQNKGAQLMAKMGWEGRGLGAKEQGIEEPVHGGDVRDRQDQFRGVGSKPDMYDEYRKQMSMRKFGGRQTF
ncbi:G-patch domain containing protein [Aphelenchoides avenae]|nr:G-patch domain containing protein [Aphelenchus avenae]